MKRRILSMLERRLTLLEYALRRGAHTQKEFDTLYSKVINEEHAIEKAMMMEERLITISAVELNDAPGRTFSEVRALVEKLDI